MRSWYSVCPWTPKRSHGNSDAALCRIELNMESTHIDGNERRYSKDGFLTNKLKVEKQFSPFCRQLLGCSAPLFCLVTIGNVVGYSSVLLRQLKNEDSEIQISLSEGSWIASISTASMAIACIVAGILMEKYGRRSLILISSVLFFFCWMILSFGANFYGLLLGRSLTGMCSGLLSSPSAVFIGEITQPSYRGLFLSAQGFALSVGILIPHALGLYLKWKSIAMICALLPLLCFVLMIVVPESPPWLVAQGRIEEAEKAFIWSRGHNQDAVDEFDKMIEGQRLAKLQDSPAGLKNLLSLAQSKLFYKPFLILLLYFATLQSCGLNVISNYTIIILKNSLGENMNEYVATIILDVTRVITSALCCIVVNSFGRRPLTIFSGMATATTLIALSIYLYAASKNDELESLYAIPMTLYTLFIIFITIGLNPLAWTVKSELFPLRFRGTGSSMITFMNSIFVFVTVKTTPSLFVVIGEHGVFFLFGVACLTGTILLTIFLPETRNKTLQEIEDSYRKPNGDLKQINIE